MKNTDSQIDIKDSGGFTLLELLLVVGLTTSLIIGFGRLSTLWANRELAELSGAHMNQITEVVESYIRTERPAANIDITGVIEADYLPTGMTMTNPLRRDVRVIVRRNADEYQALIYTFGDPIPHSRLLPAARAAGSAGGYVSDINPNIPANTAISAFGLWETDMGGTAGATVNNDGGQLVSYISFSLEEVFGAYLYRENLGDPDLNTMFTDLNFNCNAIRAASEVETNDLDVYNTATIELLTVNGDTTFNGSVDISGTMDIGDQLTVRDDMVVSAGDIVVGTAGSGGVINAQSMNVNTANASVINAPDISATTLTVDANTTLTSNLSVIGTVDIAGEIQANTLNANELTVQGIATTDRMIVNNNVQVDGDATITGSAIIDVLAVDDCVTIANDPNSPYGAGC